MGFTANVRSSTMRRGGMGRSTMRGCRVRRALGGMGCATARGCGMGATCIDSSVGPSIVGMYYYRCAAFMSSTIGRSTTSTVISSSSTAAEAMAAPTVAIAPTRPRAHAEKDNQRNAGLSDRLVRKYF
jgi:hypothetical protein